jgi:hypothetical protein
MDILQKNTFLAACVGVLVATVGATAGGYFVYDPSKAIAGYNTLKNKVPKVGDAVSEGTVAKAQEAAAKRAALLVDVEREFIRRAMGTDLSVYLVHWGGEVKTAVVTTAEKKVVLEKRPPNLGVANEFRAAALEPRPQGPPLAALVLVDPKGSPEALEEWRRKNPNLPSAGFILMPRTLHDSTFTDEESFERFQKRYAKLSEEIARELEALPPDDKLAARLKADYIKLRERHAEWVMSKEFYAAVRKARQAGEKEPTQRENARPELIISDRPDVTPADAWKRLLARARRMYWVDKSLYTEPWAFGVQKPFASQVFFGQIKAWTYKDIVAAVNAVNTANTANKSAAPLPKAEYDKLLARGKDIQSKLEAEEKAAEAARSAGGPGAGPALPAGPGGFGGGGGVGTTIPDPPEPRSPAMEDLLRDVTRPKAADGSPNPLQHAANTKQGVLGSDIKMIEAICFWGAGVTDEALKDTDCLFLPPEEPIYWGTPPGAAPGAPGAPKAEKAAKAEKAESDEAKAKPAPTASFRLFKVPAPTERYPLSIKAGDAKSGGLVRRVTAGLSVGGRDLTAPGLIEFARPVDSVTTRGGTNNHFVVHFSVHMIATPRGIENFVRAMESRRFYTLARIPTVREVARSRFPAEDFGPEPVVEADLAFESVIFHQALVRAVDTSELGDPVGGQQVVVSLMPIGIWEFYCRKYGR